MGKSYMIVDDRCSGGKIVEFDTVACRHCSAQIKIVRGQREGFWCNHCMGPVCVTCAPKNCYPMARKLEEAKNRRELFRVMGI